MWTIKGIPDFGVLSASKAGVRSFARMWANELRERRLRVNVVSPSPVHTPSTEKATRGRDNAERLLSELSKDIPLGRPGTPDDIAKAVVFLASEDASYVNGAELFVDGRMVQIQRRFILHGVFTPPKWLIASDLVRFRCRAKIS